jgi:hypothetical protein
MDVVLICIDGLEYDVGMILRPRFEKFLEIALNPRVENIASVFRRSHQMVVTGKDTVAHSTIHGHRYNIC